MDELFKKDMIMNGVKCFVHVFIAANMLFSLSGWKFYENISDKDCHEIINQDEELRSQFLELQRQIKEKKHLEKVESCTFRQEALIFTSDRDPADVVIRRTEALLKHLETNIKFSPERELKELRELKKRVKAVPLRNKTGRYTLFKEACNLRREVSFHNPVINFNDILFIKREINPWEEKQGNHMCDQYFGFHSVRNGGVFVLKDAFSPSPSVINLMDSAICGNGRFKGKRLEGGFLSPELSFDGEKALFAFTEGEKSLYQWNKHTTYHIFSMNVDGTGLTQLTDGNRNDFDPCFLPNGRIAFISERRGGYGRCHGRPVPSFTLHTMHDDGSDITMLSPHETNEWQPSVNGDGMIVFTRWDYVDRGFNQAHHPWICTPDGRDPRDVHGNYAVNAGDRPHMEISIRAVPDSKKYVATAACHHGQAYGSLVLVDPMVYDDDKMGPVKRLTPEQLFPESEYDTHHGEGMYATAWPLDEYFYLCVYSSNANNGKRETRHEDHNYGIYLIDAFGNKELLYRDQSISCLDPIPLIVRPVPPVIPHQTLVGIPPVNGKKLTPVKEEDLPEKAKVALINVYNTRAPFPEGTKIKSLRIIQLLPKTTPIANKPIIGYGNQKGARIILGTVPVEDDGSAYFEMPVNSPVYFQALDENGMAVQSMKSATWVAPGETLTCKGCHESRQSAVRPSGTFPRAMRKNPSSITTEVDGTNPYNFTRLVQPVLDRKCAGCHAEHIEKGRRGIPDLRAKGVIKDKKIDPRSIDPDWSTSYINLRDYAFFWNYASFTVPKTTPGKFGAMGSRLYKMLKKGHHDTELSEEELHRIVLWLDSNSNFFGSYNNTSEQAQGKVVCPDMY